MISIADITEKIQGYFWAKVNKTDGCWEWMATKAQGKWPYGNMRVGKRSKVLVHRVSWMIHFGNIPEAMQVCHHCDNPSCVRPDHLFLGTQKQNIRDCIAKGRFMTDDRAMVMADPEVRAKMGAKGDRNGARTHPEKVKRGKGHERAKLTESDVRQIRRLYRRGEYGYIRLGNRFGVSSGAIRSILHRKNWKHVV